MSRRNISKTSSATNSEAIVTDRQKNEAQQNVVVPNRWMRLNRFSNNRFVFVVFFEIEIEMILFRKSFLLNCHDNFASTMSVFSWYLRLF